jgi:two-component system, cell cycle sensor histidine kinase and response regulator CckA
MQSLILESVLGSLSEGVVIIDAQGRTIVVNPAAERIVGMKAQTCDPSEWARVYGFYCPDRVTPYPLEQFPIYRALQHGEMAEGAEVFVRNAGQPQGLWVVGSAQPIRDAAGKIAGAVAVFRDVSAAHRERTRMAVLYRVSRHLADFENVSEALQAILQSVCEELGWPVGAVWRVDSTGEALRCTQAWHSGEPGAAAFEQRCRDIALRRGEGPPGAVWASGETLWTSDLPEALSEQRRDVAQALGLHSTVAFPVAFCGEILGVVEFFSRETESPDDDLRKTFASIGGQLAQAIERQSGEQAIRELNAELRQRAEEHETKYRLAAKATNDAIWDWNCLTDELDFRDGATVFGYAPEDVSPRKGWWAARIHPEDSERVLAGFAALRKSRETSWTHQYRFARKDGSYALVEDRGYVVRDASGRATRLVGAMADITERRRGEELLRSERDFSQTLVDASPALIITIDPDMRLRTVNPATLWTLRYRPGELIGKDYVATLVPPEEQAARRAAFERLGRATEPVANEGHILTRTGERVLVEWHGQAIRKPDGALDYILGIGIDITDRKRAEEALRASEAQYRAIVERQAELVCRYTPDYRYSFVNEALCRHLNKPREELLGRDFMVFLPESDREKVRQNHRSLTPDKPCASVEHRVTNADGRVRWVQWTDQAFFNADGKVIEFQAAGRDVTERHEAEQDLARSLSLLKATLEATADGIVVVDSAGKIVRFNRKMAGLWGISESALANLSAAEARRYVSEHLKGSPQELSLRGVVADSDATSQDVFELPDGRVFERYSQPQKLEGRTIGRVWSFREITQQRQVEQSLDREREFLKTLLENVSEGIIACDAEGRIIICNQAARVFHGVPNQGDYGEWPGLTELFHPDGKTPLRREEVPLEAAFRGKVLRNAEIAILHPGTPPRTALVHADPILSPTGQKLGAVAVIRDVTEEKHLQRQLLQTQKLESIGTLAGGIAHDFNNLLAVILGNASVHLRDPALPVKVRDSLADIADAAERGSSLTHQLLAYARGGLQRLGPTDLNSVIDSVLRMLRRTAPPQIDLVLDLGGNLPRITADPSQMQQVVMNLALNAIQATNPPNEVRFSTAVCELSADQAAEAELAPGHYVCFTVQDHGCGMDANTLERVFEPFFTTKPMGRGMGLAATLGIIKSHQGAVTADSTPGAGTTFRVYFPMATGAPYAHHAGPEPTPQLPPRGSETVLVIDDDPAVTRTVGQMLSSLGYCVVEHTDVDAAMAFLQTNGPELDLVLMDLNLPKYSAEEMFSAIVLGAPSACVLLASGHSDPQVIQTLRDRGAVDFLHKPFTVFTLATAVRSALDACKLRREPSEEETQ